MWMEMVSQLFGIWPKNEQPKFAQNSRITAKESHFWTSSLTTNHVYSSKNIKLKEKTASEQRACLLDQQRRECPAPKWRQWWKCFSTTKVLCSIKIFQEGQMVNQYFYIDGLQYLSEKNVSQNTTAVAPQAHSSPLLNIRGFINTVQCTATLSCKTN